MGNKFLHCAEYNAAAELRGASKAMYSGGRERCSEFYSRGQESFELILIVIKSLDEPPRKTSERRSIYGRKIGPLFGVRAPARTPQIISPYIPDRHIVRSCLL